MSKKRSFGSVFLFNPASLQPFGWLLFTLSWLLPNHYHPWLGFHSEALALASLAAIVAGILLTHKTIFIQWPAVAYWVLCAALIPWIQWFTGISIFAGDAVLVSGYLSAWAAAMVVGYHLGRQQGQNDADPLMHMLWIAALCSAMLGLAQWLKLEDRIGVYIVQTDAGDPAMGNLAQPNQLATLLLMGMVAYYYVFERKIIGSVTLILGISVMTYLLVLTHSRAGMVGILAVAAFLLAKRSRMQSRLSAWAIVAWILLFVAMSFVSPTIDQALFLDVEIEPLFTVNGRRGIWSQVWAGIQGAPWTGYGWNQTFSATSVGAVAYPGSLIAAYAHNVLLDMVAWNGIPLGLALIVLGGYWFCTRMYRVTGTTGIFAMAGLLPFVLHGMVEYSFAYAYFLLASGLLIGVIEATLPDAKEVVVRRNLMAAALVVWVAVGICIVYEYMLVEEDVVVTRFENLRVGATDPSYVVPTIRLLSQMATLQRATRIQPTTNMTAQQLDDMRRAVLRFPTGGLALRYAVAQALNGDPTGAVLSLKTIHGVYGPRYFSAAKEVWQEQAQRHPELTKINLGDIQP